MTDTPIRISVTRRLSTWCEETWFCEGPLPENWDTMDRQDRFDWVESNHDDVYTHAEWPEENISIMSVEVEP